MDTVPQHALFQQELEFTFPIHPMKRCSKCGETKQLSAFRSRKGRKSGVTSWCKKCLAAPIRYRECLLCNETKPVSEFLRGNSRANKDICTQCLASHPGQKECSRCGQVKPVSEFSPRKGRRSGYVSRCKQCISETQAYRPYIPGKYPYKPELERNKTLKLKYGITSEEFDAMLEAQGGVCKVCKGPPHGRRNVYHVDHDHVTGKVRGLLCHKCNVALGMVQDSPDHLKALIAYLEESS